MKITIDEAVKLSQMNPRQTKIIMEISRQTGKLTDNLTNPEKPEWDLIRAGFEISTKTLVLP